MTPEQIEIRQAKERLPRWLCHKVVHAAKIVDIERRGGYTDLRVQVGEEKLPRVIQVTVEYTLKHQPHAGGFYVYYEDGYESFSPSSSFLSGYDPLPEQEEQEPATV